MNTTVETVAETVSEVIVETSAAESGDIVALLGDIKVLLIFIVVVLCLALAYCLFKAGAHFFNMFFQ